MSGAITHILPLGGSKDDVENGKSMVNEPMTREERRERALQMHLAGLSYQRVADSLGYSSKALAYKDVQKALADLGKPNANQDQVQVALARLDVALSAIWVKVRTGELGAIDRFMKIEEHRAKLLNVSGGGEQTEARRPMVSVVSEFEQRLAERRAAALETDNASVPVE